MSKTKGYNTGDFVPLTNDTICIIATQHIDGKEVRIGLGHIPASNIKDYADQWEKAENLMISNEENQIKEVLRSLLE